MNKELRDITVSAIVISLAFSWSSVIDAIGGGFSIFLTGFLTALLAVGSGFIIHELAHRYMARKFGAEAKFIAWRNGLLLAMASAVITGGSFVFAAPGAVQIHPKLHSRWYKLDHRAELEEIGIVSIAGPITNLLLSFMFISLHSITGFGVFGTAAWINAWLALFNSLPIPPLDGSKVITWDIKAWALVIIVSIIALVLA